jgi:hypothetical protein
MALPVAPTYTGPGDVIAGATAWWGLRAYSAAAIGSNAVRIIRASDSTQQNFVTLADGSVDVASITSFLNATTGKVVTLFDQTGNGFDATQATDANRPTIALNVVNGQPVVRGGAGLLLQSGVTVSNYSAPNSFSSVVKRTGATSSQASWAGDTNNNFLLQYKDAANTVRMWSGSFVENANATEGSWHTVHCLNNGASSSVVVDGGTPATGDTGGGTIGSGTAFIVCNDGFTTNYLGDLVEHGVWPGDKSASFNNLDANQGTYWGI